MRCIYRTTKPLLFFKSIVKHYNRFESANYFFAQINFLPVTFMNGTEYHITTFIPSWVNGFTIVTFAYKAFTLPTSYFKTLL